MLTAALVPGDEVIDNDGEEYEVIAAGPHEVVVELLTPNIIANSYNFFIFARTSDGGGWVDRETAEVHLVDFV
jgi:hypothetical protein